MPVHLTSRAWCCQRSADEVWETSAARKREIRRRAFRVSSWATHARGAAGTSASAPAASALARAAGAAGAAARHRVMGRGHRAARQRSAPASSALCASPPDTCLRGVSARAVAPRSDAQPALSAGACRRALCNAVHTQTIGAACRGRADVCREGNRARSARLVAPRAPVRTLLQLRVLPFECAALLILDLP